MKPTNLLIVQPPSRAGRVLKILASIRPNTKWDVDAALSPLAKERYVSNLKRIDTKVKSGCYDKVIIATDPDAEGERVARDIYNLTGLDASHFNRIHMMMITKTHLDEIIDCKEPEDSVLPYMTMAMACYYLNKLKRHELAFVGVNHLNDDTVKIVLLTITEDKAYRADIYEGSLFEELSNKTSYESQSIAELMEILPYDVTSISYKVITTEDFEENLNEVRKGTTKTIDALQCFSRGICIHKDKEKTAESVKLAVRELNGMIYMLQRDLVSL